MLFVVGWVGFLVGEPLSVHLLGACSYANKVLVAPFRHISALFYQLNAMLQALPKVVALVHVST